MALQSPDFRRRQDEIVNARWQRRRDIPLAILAWIAVGIIVLMALGYVTHTVVVLIIAGLLAFALAPVVKFLARFMPRFLAILIVYLVILSGLGFLIYMIISTAASQIGSLATNLQVLTTAGSAWSTHTAGGVSRPLWYLGSANCQRSHANCGTNRGSRG